MSALPLPAPPARPRMPDEASWAALSPDARERWLDEAQSALVAEHRLSPEGRLHRGSKQRAHAALERWFSGMGRRVYLGVEEGVFYPEAEPFCPDLFAVMDVEDPGPEADRRRWVVREEGRGIDFVLEIIVHGDRRKDLVDNVSFYAALGIPEYVVYDRKRQKLYGFRLPAPGARRYEPIPLQRGELSSAVLGLGLAIEGQRLRFRAAGATLPEDIELLQRADRAVEELQGRLDGVEQELEAERQRSAALRARLRSAGLDDEPV